MALSRVQATPGFPHAMRGGAASCSLAGSPKLTPALAPKRSWGPFRISGGAVSPASSNPSNSRAASPEPVPVMPRGSPYNATNDDGFQRSRRP